MSASFLLARTAAAAASIIAAADPAIGSTLSPVFTALLPDAAAVVLFPLFPLFWLLVLSAAAICCPLPLLCAPLSELPVFPACAAVRS